MSESLAAQIKGLQGMTLAELRQKWKKVFGEETKQRHRTYLWKRLAWKIQEQHYGGLSPEAKARIEELQQEFENSPPHTWLSGRQQPRGGQSRQPGIRDPRLPMPGTVLTRRYKGQEIAVRVLDQGFEFHGRVYRSLTAIADEVTGSHWSGYRFFELPQRRHKRR